MWDNGYAPTETHPRVVGITQQHQTYEMVGPQAWGASHDRGELFQVRQGLLIILLRRFVEEYPPDREFGIGANGRPCGEGLDVVAH